MDFGEDAARHDTPIPPRLGEAWTAARRGARFLGGVLLDLLLPPQCLRCRALVEAHGGLCGDCWRAIDFLSAPCCAACGTPFDFDLGKDALCGACMLHRPVYDRARAAMRYDEASRGLVLSFKHGDRTEHARAFARWIARGGAELLRDAEVIVPVPLHRWRLLRRRYNQSAVLARAVSRASGVALMPDLLVRRRPTRSQGGLNPRQRRLNVRGAFAVRPSGAPTIAGRRVLLVDDVMTTGATVEACARALLRAGATGVDVVTLARVVRPREVPI